MPATAFRNPQGFHNGLWKTWTEAYGRHNGIWKRALDVHVRFNGNWVKVFDEVPSASVYNLYSFTYGTGMWFNVKDFYLTTNAFDTSVFVDGNFQSTVPANTTTNQSSVRFSPTPGDYPFVTATNASGSISF